MFENWLHAVVFGVAATFFTGIIAVLIAKFDIKSMSGKNSKAL